MTEEDWKKINDLLRQSWRSLADAVKPAPNALPNNRRDDSH
jgi:hypothetical protein